jgi:hypothetical protein
MNMEQWWNNELQGIKKKNKKTVIKRGFNATLSA